MTEQTPQGGPREKEKREPRDAAYWASYAETLKVAGVAEGATNINVEGRRAVGPLQGFGKMWQKTYRVGLKGAEVTPVEVIKTWKENYTDFWLEGNHFYAPLAGIAPGEVALISGSMPGGVKLSTGVMVLYADEESFSLMTPEGHPFSGWITFSSFEDEGTTTAQAQVLMRANDPLYEMGLRMGGHKMEDEIWRKTLENLAAHFGVDEPVETNVVCVDPRLQWRQYRNIWHNAGIRSAIYSVTAPPALAPQRVGGLTAHGEWVR
jgi:hypothetical protein